MTTDGSRWASDLSLLICCFLVVLTASPRNGSALLAASEQPNFPHVPMSDHLNISGLGLIRGSTTESYWRKRPIFQFQGIPYAKPPSGPRRFLPPEYADPWPGVLNATQFGRRCPQEWEDENGTQDQSAMDMGNIEDCLTLNIYTPKSPDRCPRDRLFPVMFYIHGGSWLVGSAMDFQPHYLLDKNVVLVVIQYRLGPLGFLSLQTPEIPGNAGLLDQVLALRWVNKHIDKFCGDPSNVTIFGASAGAASVTLFMISPLVEKHLFQRAIFQSGSARCSWVMDSKPVVNAVRIAEYANCTDRDLRLLASCLRSLSPQAVLSAHNQYLKQVLSDGGRANGAGGNHAVIQTAGSQRFLIEDPLKSLKEGRYKQVPVMGGVTKHEGTFFLGNIYDIFLEPGGRLYDRDYLTHNLTKVTLEFTGIDDNTGALSDVFREKYFTENQLGNFTLMTPGLIDICGVALLKGCTFRMVQENSRLVYSYLYSFNFQGRHTKFGYGYNVDYPFSGGVAHSDDLIYLFPDGHLNEEEENVARTMVDLWTNFAANGQPSPAYNVPKWPVVSTETGPYLRIELKPTVRNNFLEEYEIAAKESKSSAATLHLSALILAVTLIFCVKDL